MTENIDFQSEFDTFNEECSIQFMIDSITHNLESELKPKEFYSAKVEELHMSLSSMHAYNSLNVHRLHLDEISILEKNRKYLQDLRKNI